MKLYQVHDDLLVVPSLVGRTAEVRRFVVEISGGSAQLTQAADPVEETAAGSRSRPLPSIEAFVAEFASQVGLDQAEAAGQFVRDWEASGGKVHRNSTSVNLGAPFRHNTGGSVSIITLYVDGWAQLSIAPFAEWQECVSVEESTKLAVRFGYTEGAWNWPKRKVDLTDWEARASQWELLHIVRGRVRDEEARQDAQG